MNDKFILKTYHQKARWDGFVGKGVCQQAWRPSIHPWDAHGERQRTHTFTLRSTHVGYALVPTYTHKWKQQGE